MPTASGLPPVVSDSVFAVSTSTIIDAPREKVWTVLMDFPSYNQWYVVPFDSSPSIDCPQLVPQESIRVCHYLANHRELITLEKKNSRCQTIVDSARNPVQDQTPVEGNTVFISPVHVPPTMGQPSCLQKQSVLVYISSLDHENYRVTWGGISFPKFLLDTERWQALIEEEGGRTKYETIEVFRGPLAYIVRFFFQSALNVSFRAMAEALKNRCEEQAG